MIILRNKTIADVPGFLVSGISSGIKPDGKKDMCIIYSKFKAVSAAVFTSNKVKAAPLIINMESIKNHNTQAVVVNSGNANSCTGAQGISNAKKMAEIAARCLSLECNEVLVASTGALAIQLPMELVIPGIEKACKELSENSGLSAAEAILTTDTITKTIAVEFEIQGKKITLAGMTKGSNMVHPNMGTILTFIATDACISKELLKKALKASIDKSFNMVSIDSDTSTNDMAVILSNGVSGHSIIESENQEYESFINALDIVTVELAKMIAKDGEGSTKMLEVEVVNAQTLIDARTAARAVVSSNLLKCELYGREIKWSTIACTLGCCEISMNEENFDIFICNENLKVMVVQNSVQVDHDKALLQNILLGDFAKVIIDLKIGEISAAAWGCDLTCQYVKANAYMI